MASFYQAFVEILPEARNLRKTLAREFDAAGPEAGRNAGKGINTGVLGAVGKLAGPLAAAFAAVGIGGIIRDSIGNASDFAEAGTAITAVFGPADATIQAFAKNSATALGQSANQTLDAARTFGVFGKAAGLGGEDLAGFSTDFITLAGDLASFNNTTPEAAIEALGAGLRGESEPLRQYGVLLDDAALKARATELGIYSGTGALTQQQKVLAAQAEIMAQTGTQQGDFAKTSGGLANQQRILSAGLANLSTSFGALLLPAMTAVVGFLNRSVIPALSLVIPAVGGVFAAFSGEAPTSDLGSWAGPVEAFGGTLRTIADAVGPVLAGLGAAFGPVFETIGALFAELAPTFGALLPQVFDLITTLSPLGLIFQAIGPLIPELVGALGGLAAMLAGALGGAIAAILPAATTFAGVFVELIGGLIGTLLPIIIELVGIMGPILGAVIAAIVPLFATLAGVVGTLLGAILPLVTPILALIAPLVQLVGAILVPLIQLFAAILTPIVALVGVIAGLLVPVLGFVITVLAAVIGFIVDLLTWVVNLVTGSGDAGAQLAAVWETVKGMFAAAFAAIVSFLVGFIARALAAFSGFVSNVVNFFTKLWSDVSSAVQSGISNVVGFITGLPGKVIAVLGNLGSLLVSSGRSLIQGFIDGIKGMIGAVSDAVGGVMDFVGGFFPNSPAERGQFSGAGWRRVRSAGIAIGEEFQRGLDTMPSVEFGSSVSLPSAPRFDSASSVTSQATAARFPETVTLVDANGSLLGRMDVLIQGQDDRATRIARAGVRRDFNV